MSMLLSLNPLITNRPEINFPGKIATINKPSRRISCSQNTTPQQQQLNLSVLRFTLGIPGLDESYLPRYIGYTFGAFLLLNHFVGSDSSSITPAQLRTEALGISLAAFSVVVPYLGKFLKGATPTDKKTIPEGAKQIFVMSPNIEDTLKENLAWGTYVLLRNTNSISVLISVEDALCARGYWKTPIGVSKENFPHWFEKQTQKIGFLNLKDTTYFQQTAELEVLEMVPEGTRSFLVQPIMEDEEERNKGFVLLASSIEYAYNDKDKAWIAAIANKFKGREAFLYIFLINLRFTFSHYL
ncbi:hypothetical protein RD792_011824 [Penstemon davidsonii]|uniref:Protein COFACTOR ASSEMBLY OF COMPLEX C SUBUNIT B CCB2, chloroplastic n=1 Tax=Penstemon davidsonii TaxID=160366 RepID=A0ABR0CVL7_9LAMI|nr:hypothetical protein RD792_011824 [Penstemon davidsonii]